MTAALILTTGVALASLALCAYAQLQESLTGSEWVQVPTDSELHEGVWP